jgi:hypothetical protein
MRYKLTALGVVLLAGLICLFGLSCEEDQTTTGSDQITCPDSTSGPTEHYGIIDTNEVWTADASPHIITYDLYIQNGATLTIEPCAEIQLAADVGITIDSGALVAVGQNSAPILFTSYDDNPWDKVLVRYPGTAQFAYVTFENGGSDLVSYDGATLVIYGDSDPPLKKIVTVDHVLIRNSGGYGVIVGRYGGFDNSTNLTVTGSGQSDSTLPYPVAIQAQAVGTLPSGGDYTGNTVDAILVNQHPGYIHADAVFPNLGIDYHLKRSISVGEGATLTIQPGVTIRLGKGIWIDVGDEPSLDEGTLIAVGSASAPITFTALDTLPWGYLKVDYPGTATLAYVTIENGGGDDITYDGASVVAYANSELPVKKILTVNNVTISNSAGYGMLVQRMAGFGDGSSNLVITGSGSRSSSDPDYTGFEQPMLIQAQALGTIPTGNYTGNALDEFLVNPYKGIRTDLTIRNVQVPYHVIGWYIALTVYQTSTLDPIPTLTIQAGVTIKFDSTTRLQIGQGSQLGALRIEGTASNPVVMTSAVNPPSAGDWRGIEFDDPGAGAAANSIEYARIEYAGGDCSCIGWSCESATGAYDDEAAVLILGWRPDFSFIRNTTIYESAGHGINRGWRSDDPAPDFTATNTFINVTNCNQTTPVPLDGNCSGIAPCTPGN